MAGIHFAKVVCPEHPYVGFDASVGVSINTSSEHSLRTVRSGNCFMVYWCRNFSNHTAQHGHED